MIDAVFVDIGGTLWSDRWAFDDASERVARLQERCGLDQDQAFRLLDDLVDRTAEAHSSLRCDIWTIVRESLRALRLSAVEPEAVRAAMCLPAAGRIEPFPGWLDLLGGARGSGAQVIGLSNTVWRARSDFMRDFASMGAGGAFDAFICSCDTIYRKPHPEIFARALQAAGDPDPAHCVMIGNSERNDIAPAVAVGMRGIRVAIEEPEPDITSATSVASSLSDALRTLLHWAGAPRKRALPRDEARRERAQR